MALLTGSFPIVVLLLQTFIRWLRPALKGTPAQTTSQPGNFITMLSLFNNVTQAVLSIYLFVGLTTGMYNNWCVNGVAIYFNFQQEQTDTNLGL